jgi:cysteine synthase A
VQNYLGDDAVVVTVFSDSNKKYLTTDLMNEEPVKDGYLSTEVEFLDYRGLSK